MRLGRTGRGIAIVADVRLRQEVADGAVGERLDQRRRQIDRALRQTVERIVNEGLVKTGVDIAARQPRNQAIRASGSLATLASRKILPLPSTTHTLEHTNDTSIPA